MHVVIGTDGSPDAVAAARQGLALLAQVTAVTVVAAVDAPPTATAGFESGFAGGIAPPAVIDEDWKAVEAEAAATLDRTIAVLDTDAEVEVERLMVVGGAGAALCQVATDRSADVVVVGSRGLGAIRRVLLGSVSTYVVANAPCPVLVVRGADG